MGPELCRDLSLPISVKERQAQKRRQKEQDVEGQRSLLNNTLIIVRDESVANIPESQAHSEATDEHAEPTGRGTSLQA
uniref:Uncharacterized protein n=1 Tax=Thermosporothrix sp. COM3 TaxID=2490863 RepID=A0A455SK10_9CHLR|nr:hypothetical protein KTC_20500 [Thermosporothrix sp. COM3]